MIETIKMVCLFWVVYALFEISGRLKDIKDKL